MAKAISFKAAPASADEDRARRAEEFVSGADVRRKPRAATHEEAAADPMAFMALPDNVQAKVLNLRLTEREKGALEWVAETGRESMHEICVRAVREAINTRLMKLAKREL